MLCEKGKSPYSFSILLTQWHESPTPKFTNFHILIIPLPWNVTLFSKSPYLIVNIKINYGTGCIGRFSEKRDLSKNIATSKMELFVALFISFQSLTNFKKNSNIDAMGVLNASLEYYNLFWNFCRWSN